MPSSVCSLTTSAPPQLVQNFVLCGLPSPHLGQNGKTLTGLSAPMLTSRILHGVPPRGNETVRRTSVRISQHVPRGRVGDARRFAFGIFLAVGTVARGGMDFDMLRNFAERC